MWPKAQSAGGFQGRSIFLDKVWRHGKQVCSLPSPVSKAVEGEEMPGIVRAILPPCVNKHDNEKPTLLDGGPKAGKACILCHPARPLHQLWNCLPMDLLYEVITCL